MNFVGYADFRFRNLLVCDRELKKRHDIPSRGDIKKSLARFRKKTCAFFIFSFIFLKVLTSMQYYRIIEVHHFIRRSRVIDGIEARNLLRHDSKTT